MGTAATRYKSVRSKIRLERRRQIGAAAHEALAAALPCCLGLGAIGAGLKADTLWLSQAGQGSAPRVAMLQASGTPHWRTAGLEGSFF